MYKKVKKWCSTPVEVNLGSITLSLSDVKPSSSETGSTSLIHGIHHKRFKQTNVNLRKKKCGKKVGKFKEFVRKIKGRKVSESNPSDSEWEDQSSLDNSQDNQYKTTFPLFESPERERDVGVEKDYVLSPPLIGPRGRNFPAIEDAAIDKEEEKHIFPLGENKIETYNSSPTFDKAKLVRTYSSMKKKKKLKQELLKNKGSADWLVDVKIPTASADLLWKKFIKDHDVKLPQLPLNDIEKNDPRNESNNEDNNTDNDDILVILNEKKHLSKINKLSSIKGGCSRSNRKFPMEVREFVKVNGQWKRSITEKDKSTDILSTSHVDPDLQKENGTLMSFNEFHARSKMKRSINTDCLSQKTSNVKIRSVTKFKGVVYKKTDGNFDIIKY